MQQCGPHAGERSRPHVVPLQEGELLPGVRAHQGAHGIHRCDGQLALSRQSSSPELQDKAGLLFTLSRPPALAAFPAAGASYTCPPCTLNRRQLLYLATRATVYTTAVLTPAPRA